MLVINKGLSDYIIKYLGAYYEQHPNEVKSNVNNTESENKWYLGTYFPKSFKESYVIFSDIFAVLKDYGFLKNKNDINILDIGSGTGGQIFGLLQVFHEKIDKALNINIYAVDGNKNALEIQKKILENYWKVNFSKHNINIFDYCEVFNSGDDIAPFLSEKFKKNSIDMALSFKCFSEILKNDNQVYTKALMACENILRDGAVLVLEDVAMEIETYGYLSDRFIPLSINDNIKKYLNGNHLLNIVIPLCCFRNVDKCTKDDCYSQCIIYSKMNKSKYPLKIRREELIDCKITYNLFIKNIDLYDKFSDFLTTVSKDCPDLCISKKNHESCYCAYNGKFTEYFGSELAFIHSQFSLAKIQNLYNECVKNK